MKRGGERNPPQWVLHITDTHLRPDQDATLLGVDTAASLDAVLTQALEERRPAAIVASGDLAHDPTPACYARFHRHLRRAFDGAALCLPGNHDLAAPMRPLLAPDSLRLDGWEILGFDTHADDEPSARFGESERQALGQRIRASRAPNLLLVCHHPPLPVGCPWLDKDCIPQGSELLDFCAADPRVRGLIFGHVHQAFRQAFRTSHGDMTVLGTPSTCFQFEPGSRDFAIDRSAETGAPGYRWLELDADGTWRSEVRRVQHHPLNIDMSDRS